MDPVISDLVSAHTPRVAGKVDVLVFNPPYVETDEEEASAAQVSGVIERAWAGGAAGMVVTSRVLEMVDVSLGT